MDLVQLKRFLAAAEAGNLRQAATRLHISQPALTQSIKSLELALGVELFERGARGVSLTRFGHVLVPRAKMMLNERERIARDLDEARSEDSMRVTVGVAPYFSRQLFPAAALRLTQRFPNAKIQVVEGHTTELARLLEEGAIEFAFCVANPAVTANPSIEFAETYTEHYSVMARVGHPLFRRRRTTDRELAECSWIVYDMQRTRGFLAQHFEGLGFATPRVPFSTLSLPLMVTLIIKSDLVALMPEDFVWPEVAASRLRRVTGHTMNVNGAAGLVTRKGAVHGTVAQELMKDLKVVCAEARKAAGRVRAGAREISAATFPPQSAG